MPPGEGKAGQQLPQLVDGESPEKLAALKAALQQLGDELQPVAAAGEAPNPEVGAGFRQREGPVLTLPHAASGLLTACRQPHNC